MFSEASRSLASTEFKTCPSEQVLARLLALLRDDCGFSQAKLAERVGVSQTAVASVEACRSKVTLGVLDRVGEALGIPGLLLHALHAQALLDLRRAGCRVAVEGWRRPRGVSKHRRGAPVEDPDSPESGTKLVPHRQLDRWLRYWLVLSLPPGWLHYGTAAGAPVRLVQGLSPGSEQSSSFDAQALVEIEVVDWSGSPNGREPAGSEPPPDED